MDSTEACVFCRKSEAEAVLIDMGMNSVIVDDDCLLEFSDLLRDLFDAKLPTDQTIFSCEDCKNLLVQFHIFKQDVKNSVLLKEENENIKKVTLFLEENEDEEVSCMRYNRCLTLVPASKRSFMETLKNWQPHVVLDKVMEHPARKRPKLDVPEVVQDLIPTPAKEESQEDISVVDKSEEFIEETLEAETEETCEDMTEDEWLEAAVRNGELSEVNGVVESWICTHCEQPEKFFNLAVFREHLLTCHTQFYEQINFEEQVVFDEGEEQTIQEYQTSPSDNIDLIAPQQQKHLCPDCDFTCESRRELVFHHKTHRTQKTRVDQKISEQGNLEKFCCTDCCFQFSAHSHYQAHLNGHRIFEIVSKHSTHPTCEECQMMFCEETFLSTHQDSHGTDHFIDSIPVEGFFLKYGIPRPDLETVGITAERALKCGHCTRSFDDSEACRLHQMIFHVKTLRCPIEHREFNGNQAFSIHLKNNHPELFGEDIKFQCSVCKMEFESLYAKLGHMKTCDKKSFSCTHCDKKFSQKCYLTMHLRRATGQSSVTCEICEKVCRDKGDFLIHMRSHSNVKPFKCSICPKAYKTSSARAAHLETHMDGFTCSFCKSLFNSRRTLTKHIKTKHYLSVDAENSSDGVIAVEIQAEEVYS